MCTLVPLAWSDCWTSQGQLGPNQVPWGLPKPVVEGEPAAEELLLGRPGHTSAGPWKGWATVARTVVREEGDPRPSVRVASPGPERLLATSQDRARLGGSWAAVLVDSQVQRKCIISYMIWGLLMGKQPRAPSDSRPLTNPKLGAAALAQGEGPPVSR